MTAPRMRAIVQRSFGGPEVLRPAEADRPVPGPGEVLVRVRAAGVNPIDCAARAGELPAPPAAAWTIGRDLSGVVQQVAGDRTGLRPGDQVYGMLDDRQGAYAEYVAAPARFLAHKPAGLSHLEAAGLPLAGLTAWQMLTETARLRPGQRVLVHAAAGGVGHLAVQLAKQLGARVLGRGGLLITVRSGGNEADLAEAARLGVRTARFLVRPDGAGLVRLAELVEAARLRVVVAAVLPLERAAAAHAMLEGGHTTGKLVLAVGPGAAPGPEG